jgi:hypothetical protein
VHSERFAHGLSRAPPAELRFVIVFAIIVVLACVGWAVLVQRVVPDACTYSPPPTNAQ